MPEAVWREDQTAQEEPCCHCHPNEKGEVTLAVHNVLSDAFVWVPSDHISSVCVCSHAACKVQQSHELGHLDQ